jgi:hypothetical protein
VSNGAEVMVAPVSQRHPGERKAILKARHQQNHAKGDHQYGGNIAK